MSTIKVGWLNDKNGDKFAPKTLTSQVTNNEGISLDILLENSGKVDSVNGVSPDENGNITIDIPSVPTKTSQLINDSGFITTIPSEYITESELDASLDDFGGTVEVTSGAPSKENTVMTLNPNAGETYIYTTDEVDKKFDNVNAQVVELSEQIDNLPSGGSGTADVNIKKWRGKRIVVDGSSITTGGNGETQPTWSDYIKDMFGLDTVYNRAGSGTGWTTSGTTTVITRMLEYETDADAVILMGDYNGIYGYTQGVGTIDDEPASGGSYYARLKYIAEYLIDKYPLCPIIWVVEPPRSNPTDEALEKTPMGYDSVYAKQSECIEKVAEYYGFPHCNLMKNTVFRPWIQANYNVTTADGTHPYNIIQHTMAQVIAETMKRTPLLYGYEAPDTPVEPDDPEVTLSSISATYTGGDVAVGTALTDLTGIAVTGTYSDGSTATITGYTLSGTIAEGTNTITVSYGGKTTTFMVTGVAEETEELSVLYQLQNREFDGTSGGIDTGIAPFTTDRSYTIAMKFTPTLIGNYRRIFAVGTSSFPVMGCYNNANAGFVINHSKASGNDYYSDVFGSNQPNEEKMVVMTHTEGQLKNTLYYISNGELISSTYEIPDLFVTTGNLIIGNNYNSPANNAYYFKGTIADFTLYRGVLDETGIKSYIGVN